jgi:type IV secretion system protein VirB4
MAAMPPLYTHQPIAGQPAGGIQAVRRRRLADPASWLVDQERYAASSADGAHHESRYYPTFLYLPPRSTRGRAERLLYECTEATAVEIEPHAQLEWFVTETDRAFQMLENLVRYPADELEA